MIELGDVYLTQCRGVDRAESNVIDPSRQSSTGRSCDPAKFAGPPRPLGTSAFSIAFRSSPIGMENEVSIAVDHGFEITSNREGPKIVIPARDYARLVGLVQAALNSMPDLAAGLSDELDRAYVLPDECDPGEVVRMGSEVQFRDHGTGSVRTVTLVYPNSADIADGKISILTPVGTALLGLAVGDSIDWEAPSGQSRALTVLSVRTPATNK